ncbi:MAG: ABC transporter ATP-binding protein [Candidatus Hodarchaeales archaeon]|jgi:putative ABC transport system ATP-binding protein
MSISKQKNLRGEQKQSGIGILVFLALIIIEFASNFGIAPLLSSIAFNPVIGSMISNFLMLGYVLGILGFLTYSRESLLAGTFSSAGELIICFLILIQTSQGLINPSILIQVGGITILVLVAFYISFSTSFFKISDLIAVHTQVQDRTSTTVLEIQDLAKHYDLGEIVVKALDGVSFEIEKGEMIAIMGPSGSGKSTLLNLLGLLDSPTSGKILLDGQDVSKMDSLSLSYERNSKIGFIFQSYNLLNRSSVLKNVELPTIVNFAMKKKEREKRGKKFLTMLGLEQEMYRTPKTLSGGQQQRVAIARSLMNDPSIILADEPTGNLDSKSGTIVMDVIKKLNAENGITVILVTHDREVANYADRIFNMKDGKIIQEKVIPTEFKDQFMLNSSN